VVGLWPFSIPFDAVSLWSRPSSARSGSLPAKSCAEVRDEVGQVDVTRGEHVELLQAGDGFGLDEAVVMRLEGRRRRMRGGRKSFKVGLRAVVFLSADNPERRRPQAGRGY
jgi:hypothetical protein